MANVWRRAPSGRIDVQALRTKGSLAILFFEEPEPTMPIVSSIIADIGTQSDGRRWVREVHTDHTGAQYVRSYLAGALDDENAALAAYAVQLAADVVAAEISRNIGEVMDNGSLATVGLVHSTAAQNRTALRTAYQNATRVEAVMIADFLSSLTDGQLQSLFSMTVGQVTNLRTNKLTPAATTATAIRAAAGQ